MLAVQMTDEELTPELLDSGALELYFEREELEGSLYVYVQAAWPLVEPAQPFISNWHIRVLCRELEYVYHRKKGYERVIINVPPGTLKSLLIEVFFPTWVWAKSAKKRFMTASYGQHLTMRDNLRARQIVESPWYRERWPNVVMQEDQNTKTRYNTTEHGWRIATSVGGQGIGEHPDFIFIDDPTNAAQAESEAGRQEANDWFDRTIATRLGRNPSIILIMQRLHEDDLSGHLLKRGGWRHICWPMRYEAPRPATEDTPAYVPDPLDPRTVEGELLFPALFPEDKVKQLELDLGAYGAAGQLQQRPAPLGGGLFKQEWFQFVDAPPAASVYRTARGWDTAASEGKGDYTAGVKIAEEFTWQVRDSKRELKSTGIFYVLDVVRDQLGPDGVDKLMRRVTESDGLAVAQREEREGGASGKSVIAARLKLLVGFDYKEVNLGANKVVRAKPFRSQCEGGNVRLVRAPWNAEYVRELCGFPTGAHDDQVDGSSCAFNSVLLEPPPRKVSISWS